MPESAVAELAPAPTAEETRDAESIAIFDKASKENAGPEPEVEPTPEPTPKAKVDPAKPTAQPAKGEIPEELLTGVKPEAPTEKEDDDPFKAELPASASEKHKVNWRRAREANEANLARIAAMAKEIETHKATPRVDEAMAAKFKTVEQERNEARNELSRTAYEKTPEMRELHSAALNAIAKAKTYVPESVSKGIVEAALDLKGHARLKYLEDAGLSPTEANAVDARISDAEELKQDFDRRLEKHNEGMATHEQLAKARAEQEKQAQIDEAGKVFDTVLKSLIPKLAPLQKLDPEKYPEWNQRADEIPKLARRMFTNDLELAEAAELAVMGASAVEYRKIAETLQGRLKEANATIAKMTAGQPSAGSTTNGQFHPSNDATGDSADAQSTRAFERAAAANRNQ